jgi:thioesterase domain-containing protein
MNTLELQEYLHEHIPLSKAMSVEVLEATADGVKLFAPLGPNINHRDTVFGGSASALAILCAWAWLYLRLKRDNMDSRIVIQRSTMEFELPIVEGFEAWSAVQDATAWLKFINTLERRKRARMSVAVALHCQGERVGRFEGDFVALSVQ